VRVLALGLGVLALGDVEVVADDAHGPPPVALAGEEDLAEVRSQISPAGVAARCSNR
jgi:hypothetical protein